MIKFEKRENHADYIKFKPQKYDNKQTRTTQTWKKLVMISTTKKQREMVADFTTLWINQDILEIHFSKINNEEQIKAVLIMILK